MNFFSGFEDLVNNSGSDLIAFLENYNLEVNILGIVTVGRSDH